MPPAEASASEPPPDSPPPADPQRPESGDPPAPPAGTPPAPPGSPPPPPGPGPGAGAPPKPRGLREQLGATYAAARQLIAAHIALGKAEASVILEDAKQVAVRIGIALALVVYIGLLVSVGTALFLGEWLFGSMGWGILHGTLFSVATAFALVLGALHIRRTYLAGMLLVALVVGVAVGIVLGFAMPHAAYVAIGENATGLDASTRPLLIGLAIWGAIFAILGLVLGARSGGLGGALGGFVIGAVVGALFGAFTAISFSLQVGVALGVTATLIVWPLLCALSLRGYDWEDLKRRFTPQASIDAATETMDFVKARMPGSKEDGS